MGISKMKVFIALAFLAVAASASPSLRLRVSKTNCGPGETECPAGCCPEANWYCCSDNTHCAATPNDCPNGPKSLKNLLKKKVAKTNCGPDETECPAGCCPEANWYCCADNQHCAATAANCPFKNIFAPKVAEPTCEDCTGAVNSVGDVIESEAKIAEIMDFLKGDAYCGSLGDADCVAVIDALMPYAMPTLAGLLRERAAQFCCDLSTGGICC